MKFIKTWWQGKWRDPSLGEIFGDEPEKPTIIYPLPRRILIELKAFWLKHWRFVITSLIAIVGIIVMWLTSK